MGNQEDIATSLAVHEAVLGAIVLLLLLGEGSVVSVIKRLLGGQSQNVSRECPGSRQGSVKL